MTHFNVAQHKFQNAPLNAFFSQALLPKTIGFDDLFSSMQQLLNTSNNIDTYPPYNIFRETDELWRIEIALAGWNTNQLSIFVEDSTLVVKGEKLNSADGKIDENEAGSGHYIHKGISERKFERRFKIPETATIEAAIFQNGMLTIAIQKLIPEKKPILISITNN